MKEVGLKRFSGLELCRFICSISVILWHYTHFFVLGIWNYQVSTVDKLNFPFYQFLSIFYQNGANAVQIFWALSGFVFFWKYGDAIHRGSVSGSKFFILRFSRLYPLHFATLILVAFLQYVYCSSHGTTFIYQNNDLYHFSLQLFLASNWFSHIESFNGPIWSVSVEIAAYLLFYFVLRLFKPSLWLCIAVVMLTKIPLYFHSPSVLLCIHFFFAGGAVQLLLNRLDKWGSRACFALFLAAFLTSIILLNGGMIANDSNILLLAVSMIGCFALIETVFNFRFGTIAWLGDLTYASYLLHFPIQLILVLIVDWIGLNRNLFLSPITLGIFIATTFVIAWFVYRHFEMRLQSIIRSAWRQHSEVAV